MNKPLLLGGVMSTLAAWLHIAIIMGGPDWYRFFGAGRDMVELAERGSWIPALVTLVMMLILQTWGLYAFSGAGLIRRLPLLKTALVTISTIYLIRGFLPITVYVIDPARINQLHISSSLVCLLIGGAYAIGTRQRWREFSSG
jgi:putative oxidoreductase